MLFQVVIENGIKKVVPLTANTGAGAPVGSYLQLEKKSNPQGYLYCDGSTFDTSAYPALYQYLGTNKLPDCREFAFVGAEENTTNVYNASTNPNGVIHDHDVFTEGQCKDDQLQNHTHDFNSGEGGEGNSIRESGNNLQSYTHTTETNSGRTGTVTRGKRKAVFIYIKATSGLTENQQENVLNTINENNSYSTEEHPTGKKWIDGKPIYRISFSGIVADIGNNVETELSTILVNKNVDTIIKISGNVNFGEVNLIEPMPSMYIRLYYKTSDKKIYIYNGLSSSKTNNKVTYFFEYTKTTD